MAAARGTARTAVKRDGTEILSTRGRVGANELSVRLSRVASQRCTKELWSNPRLLAPAAIGVAASPAVAFAVDLPLASARLAGLSPAALTSANRRRPLGLSRTVQIRPLREHLLREARGRANGDYADPAAIHGTSMPGQLEVQSGVAGLRVSPMDLPNGARIRFQTEDGQLVVAPHAWLAAQVCDHAADTVMER